MKTKLDHMFRKIMERRVSILMLFVCLLAYAFRGHAGAEALPFVFFGLAALTEGNYLNDIVKWEMACYQSRETVTVKLGQNLEIGTVLGKIALGASPTTGTAGSNTGSGTCTSVTAGAKVKLGIYTLICVAIETGAGLFSVEDPDGVALPNAVAGSVYTNDQINFTINDGSPDFALGDSFTVEIAAGSGQVVAIDFDAVDGSQDAYGILTAACDASLAATDAVAIVRDAQIIAANLVYRTVSPAVSAAQKTAALAQLADKSIVERFEA